MTDSPSGNTPTTDIVQEFARALRAPLPQYIEVITDLTGGRGQIIAGLADHTTTNGLICDIKPHTSVKMSRPAYQSVDISRITGDLVKVYPLLCDAKWSGDLIILHPPVCAKWDKAALCGLADSCESVRETYGWQLEEIDSTIAAWMIALDRATERGEGILITRQEPDREEARDLWRHVWLRLTLTGNPLKPEKDGSWGTTGVTEVLYWAKTHKSHAQMHLTGITSTDDLVKRLKVVPDIRQRLRMGSARVYPNSDSSAASVRSWEAVRTEWQQRQKPKRDDYNLWLEDGVLKVQLSRFQELEQRDPVATQELFSLIDRTPADLVVQTDTRERLLRAIKSDLWRVHPDIAPIVEEACQGYNSARAPLYALPATQRLAYIDEVSEIKCKQDWLRFEAGKSYPVTTSSVLIERMKTKPNLQGEPEDILCNGLEMVISVRDDMSHETLFIDGRHNRPGVTISAIGGHTVMPDYSLQELLEHFDIPEVPDVSITAQESYESYRRAILSIQGFVNEFIDTEFKFKTFQLEDYARGACHDGLILAHSTGLGKSIAAITWAAIKVGINWAASRAAKGLVPLKPILIVAPETLHEQLSREWSTRFGIRVVTIDCQDTYLKMTDQGRGHLKPAFYLSSYTQMGLNKIQKLQVPSECPREFGEVAKMMYAYGATLDEVKNFPLIDQPPPGTNILMEKAIRLCSHRYRHFSRGVSEVKDGIKCIFSPSLADLSGHEFACVAIDEGVRIKSEDSITGRAIRELDPPFRLVLTATPVKNRLRDLFWLMHWAAGGKSQPHPRFPYSDAPDQQDKFSADFQVCERNLTREAKKRADKSPYGSKVVPKKRKKKPRGVPGIEVCSIHRLWKIIAPLVLRRRKQDIGEDIVAKKKQIIRVPMGAMQYDVYRYHLLGMYLDQNGKECIGPKLQALRSAAAAPNSDLLKQLPPAQEGVGNGFFKSNKDYTPKLAAALSVIEQRMREREQTIVFSALHEPLDTLSARLHQAGVPHDVLDGRTSAGQRGKLAAQFQRGLAGGGKPVMLAGAKAMGEGLSFHLANNVVLLSYDWAWDTYEQSINRCHRLNSVKDVNVWPIICTGTIDRKLEAMLDEKGDAAELVLDGRLIGEDSQEVNLFELLTIAESEFRTAQSYPEERLEQEWPELKGRLWEAWNMCKFGEAKKPEEEQPIKQVDTSLPRLLERIKRMKEQEVAA